jgi:hypothetical protein
VVELTEGSFRRSSWQLERRHADERAGPLDDLRDVVSIPSGNGDPHRHGGRPPLGDRVAISG